MSPDLEILLIAVVTAVAAALPGTFLVLRRMAMVSDAISHSILPGIVVVFFLVHDLSSPLLLVAAAITGVVAVALIETLQRSGLIAEDAAIGLVFPALFSLGVILISRFASGVHLDTDAVLLGKLEFAPFARLLVSGHDLGPSALWSMTAMVLREVPNILAISLLPYPSKYLRVNTSAVFGFSLASAWRTRDLISLSSLARCGPVCASSCSTGA